VALGVYGTTLNDELNRLANGGTYRTMGNMVDMALAAQQWATQRSVTTTVTDTSMKLLALLIKMSGLILLAYVTTSLLLLDWLQRKLSEESHPDECEI